MRFRPFLAPLAGLVALAAFGALSACATPPPRTAETQADTTEPGEGLEDPAPPEDARSTGYLSWEQLGVRMVGEGPTAGLRIDVTTLDDGAIALASDDIRAYFRDVKGRIDDAPVADDPRTLNAFLVGYTGFEKQVTFDPTLLELRSEGSTHYPRAIVPVSPGFDRRLVGLHETVYGIYLFDSVIDLNATLDFRYENLSSGSRWRSVVEAIQRARTRGGSPR